MKKVLRSSGAPAVDLEAHDAAAAALFQQDFEFADKVFRLFLDLDVAVADDAQHAAALGDAVREQRIEEQRDDVFERDEAAACGVPPGSSMKRSTWVGIGTSARSFTPVAGRMQREADGEALVRQERERVRRIDGERRQHREDALEEAGAQPVASVSLSSSASTTARPALRISVRGSRSRCAAARPSAEPASTPMRSSCCCGRQAVLARTR